MPKAQETVLEIDLNALKHNFSHLKSKLKPTTKFMAVVKAYAYGSDANGIATFMETLDVDYFAVAYTAEGIALRDSGITTPIMVLHPQAVNFKDIIRYNLEPSLYNAKVLNAFIDCASQLGKEAYPIHIKFNTGLNRLGFRENDVNYIVSRLAATDAVKVISILSHLAASEDLKVRTFTMNQIDSFKRISEEFKKAIGFKPMLHICNTSGILNYPEAHFDMVRSGIGLYGFGNSEKENADLIPIATLKSVISQIHHIEEGEAVGYNLAFMSDRFRKIGTIPIGHADGIGRQYGNGKGFVTINGKKASIIGNVCMDMIMIDLSEIDCKEGDEVIIFGKSSTAESLAYSANTISYEIVTGISQRIKRVLIR